MRTTFKRVLQAVTLISFVVYMGQMLIGPSVTTDLTVLGGSETATERNQAKLLGGKLPVEDGEERLTPSRSADDSVARETNRALFSLSASRDNNNVIDESVGDEKEKLKQRHSNKLDLNDVFISVKTTKSFHKSRLDVILKTWFASVRQQTYFFTDAEDEEFQRRTGGHLINTNCTSSHNRKALCCKMSVEFDTFMDSNKMWFCHFDDDNYVNIRRLMALLQNYSPQEDWYLGKPSIRAPLHIINRDNLQGPKISFWFATGGAGFCISRALALKMMPLASDGKFISIGDKIRLPDDVTMGYIIEHLLKHNLTVIKEFHSHLEPMKFIRPETLSEQITFSYSRYGKELNVVNVEGLNLDVDPTRFLSLHCHLFPSYSYCPN